ncbi:YqcC family protein [Cronobacter sakazakii]|uniref:YqcC family protein n=1 Tax=Cronobacter sakazakii TaxID=28141 RepID=UPI001BCCFDC8|nr:YqcC family protein [Cronobacter sakazakii]MBS4494131.1 YqcC family protein [Cronobacter sakazakii]
MERHQRVRQQLQRVEQVLRHHQQWQSAAPHSSAFESTQPFCMDTLEPYEWLQWVLIPRLHALLDAGAPLPQAFAVAPYYEVALETRNPSRDAFLATLVELDTLFAGYDA